MLRVGGKSGFCLVAPNHSLLPSNHSLLPPNDSFSPANNRWISKNKWKIWIGTAENKEIESSFGRLSGGRKICAFVINIPPIAAQVSAGDKWGYLLSGKWISKELEWSMIVMPA